MNDQAAVGDNFGEMHVLVLEDLISAMEVEISFAMQSPTLVCSSHRTCKLLKVKIYLVPCRLTLLVPPQLVDGEES